MFLKIKVEKGKGKKLKVEAKEKILLHFCRTFT